MATICKSYTFEAAHTLPNHKGKCARPHGHSYRVKIYLAGVIQLHDSPSSPDMDPSSEGMVLDFGDLDSIMKPMLDKYLDHHDLNELPGLQRSTAELVACWIYGTLRRSVSAPTFLEIRDPDQMVVRLYETRRCFAEVDYYDWMAVEKPGIQIYHVVKEGAVHA